MGCLQSLKRAVFVFVQPGCNNFFIKNQGRIRKIEDITHSEGEIEDITHPTKIN